jgi:hypothetical protein
MRRLPTLVLALALCACGDGGDTPHDAAASGPPLWRAEIGRDPNQTDVGLLRARSPVRVLLVAEGYGGADSREVVDSLDLAAGRVVRIAWTAEAGPLSATRAPDAPEGEAAAGRTAPFHSFVQVEIDREVVHATDSVVWTRPGQGRAVVQSALPSARAKAVPIGTEIELAAAAIVEADTEDVKLRQFDGRSRVLVRDPGPEDRIRLHRLLLRVEAR